MSWHTPITWDTGRLVTPTDLNEQIRDNLNTIAAGSAFMLTGTAGAGLQTTSTVVQDIPGFTATLNIKRGGRAWVMVNGYLTGPDSVSTHAGDIYLAVDGVDSPLLHFSNQGGRGVYAGNFAVQYVTGNLSIGAHTIKLRWVASAGSLMFYGDGSSPIRFVGVEV